MAENQQTTSIFGALKRLFSTDVIIRNVGGNQIKVVDTNRIQADGDVKTNRRVDRYSRLFSTTPGGAGMHAGQMQLYTRLELFRDYEVMDTDSIIASALDIYADECLHGDTIVPLLDGRRVAIKDLHKNQEQDFWLYGLDSDNTFKPVQASKVAYNGKKEIYAITLDDGTTLRSTANHVWITSDGKQVETSDIKPGTSLMALSIKLSDNENMPGYEQIWNKDRFEFTHRLVAQKNSKLQEQKNVLAEVGDEVKVLHAAGYDNVSDLAESNNHRVVSVELAGTADVYDVVNAGDNHIFAVEAVDGSKIYTHNCTAKNEFGDVLSIQSPNERVQKVLHNLFYDVLNIEFNLWPWIRNTVKYGDFFLKLDIAEKYGVVSVEPISAYEMIREEGLDPEKPHEIKFRKDFTAISSAYSTSGKNNAEEFDNYEIAHFRLLTDTNFLPYGRSIIEPSRKVWKQITLMEDAMLIHRIMRAPDKRVFKIDIGNIPTGEVEAFMEGMVNKMKKVPYIDEQTGEYNLKYNMQNILEDYYLPVRGSESGTSIESLPGVQYDSIQDIDYLKNRLLGSLKIPKAYLGYEEDTSGKATLASQDFRFARTIERVQKIITSELTKIAIVHLYAQGFTEAELIDFSLSLTAPSSVYEREKVELWSSKVTLAGDMIEKKLFSRYWIYEHLFKLSEAEFLHEQDRIIEDTKAQFRIEQIKTEGNDPIKTGQSFGTAHDIASLYRGDGGVPKGYDSDKGDGPGPGRPEEPGTYRTHEHPLGWDPLGNKVAGNVSENKLNKRQSIGAYRTMLNNMPSKRKALTETFDTKIKQDNSNLLNEDNILPEE